MDGSLFGRIALERLLGAASFRFSQGAGVPEPSMHWKCGCMALEHPGNVFRLSPCPDHRETLSAGEAGEAGERAGGG